MENILSNLPKIISRKKKRLGRGLGSGKGAKSGRGTTRHQKARGSIPLHFEGGQGRMVKKFPLLRGKGINNPFSPKPIILQSSKLNVFKEGETVDIEALIKKRLIREKEKKLGVKILADGKLEKKLVIKVPFSKSLGKFSINSDKNSKNAKNN